jgi:hypothetical protein
MVGTHTTNPLGDAPGAPNNQEMLEFMRRMTESIEALKKQNEDLNTCLMVAEGRSSRRDREREERHERDRRARIRRVKRPVDPNQQVDESSVQGAHAERLPDEYSPERS